MNVPYKVTSTKSSDCSASLAKFALILLNVVFMLAGVALTLVGVYLVFVNRVFQVVYVDNYVELNEYLVSTQL